MANATLNNTSGLDNAAADFLSLLTLYASDHLDSNSENNGNDPSTIPKAKKQSALKEDIVNFYFIFNFLADFTFQFTIYS